MRLKTELIKYFRSNIFRWARSNYANYPWRDAETKYGGLIAEVLLQRTKAEQVVPVYINFLKRFPTPEILATARLKEVSRVIYPLGLKWRAKTLKSLGMELKEKYAGRIPSDYERLIELPSVGDYVASAYLTFHLDKRARIIDSNIIRLCVRFFCIKTVPEIRRNKKFQEVVNRITPERRSKRFNYGILDLSRTICRATPDCVRCPLSSKCAYRRKHG